MMVFVGDYFVFSATPDGAREILQVAPSAFGKAYEIEPGDDEERLEGAWSVRQHDYARAGSGVDPETRISSN